MELQGLVPGKQNIERQVRNILAEYPNAKIIKETYTVTKLQGRKEFENLLKIIKQGDTLIFDGVSRTSRNSEEGFNLYLDLFNKGINLIFLKESYINTDVYRQALKSQIEINLNIEDQAAKELLNGIVESLNKYTISLAKRQIEEAFKQSEKEVQELRQRTREGLLTAKLNGKQIGLEKGTKLTTKKSIKSKQIIIKHSKNFEGSLNDRECIKLIGIRPNTYYKYKNELLNELATGPVVAGDSGAV